MPVGLRAHSHLAWTPTLQGFQGPGAGGQVAGSLAAQDVCYPLVGDWGSASCQPDLCSSKTGSHKDPPLPSPRPSAAPTTSTAAPRTPCVTWPRGSASPRRTLRTSSPSCQHTQVPEAGPRLPPAPGGGASHQALPGADMRAGIDGCMEGPGQVQPPLLLIGLRFRIPARGGLPSSTSGSSYGAHQG